MIMVLFSSLTVFAKEPTLCDRSVLPKNGVNKKWLVTDKNRYNVMNSPCVDASEKIYDFSGVLTDEEYKALKEQIDTYIEKTHMDLAIVITSLPYYTDSTNEDYAADFYDYNDFGIDFKGYSGTLSLRNTYEEDPYYDIYTFGDAQIYYDYDRLQVILDGIYYDLHNGNYYNGFSKYINYLTDYYNKGIALDGYKVDENGYVIKVFSPPWGMTLLISSVTTLIIMLILAGRNKMVQKAVYAADYYDKESSKITNRVDQFVTSHTTSYVHSSSSGYSGGGYSGGGGGHSSHSGSSGGGHSSGGGRHG